MTLPTRPHAIFSTLQGTQNPVTSQPCKEPKMPRHNPPTQADEYLSSVAKLISNKSYRHQAHPSSTKQTMGY